jgi:polyisoprenoid-binding protein YceI
MERIGIGRTLDLMRHLIAIAAVCLAPLALLAEPVGYTLDPGASRVAFSFVMEGQRTRGTMPVTAADIALDFDDFSQSRVSAVVSAAGARTPLFFATEAMRSRTVLNVAVHPDISFESTKITPTGERATIEGLLTVRGVTRPVTLQAQLFRPRGTEQGDRAKLAVLMTGTIDRRDYGASGFSDIVDPPIRLEITAQIDRTAP